MQWTRAEFDFESIGVTSRGIWSLDKIRDATLARSSAKNTLGSLGISACSQNENKWRKSGRMCQVTASSSHDWRAACAENRNETNEIRAVDVRKLRLFFGTSQISRPSNQHLLLVFSLHFPSALLLWLLRFSLRKLWLTISLRAGDAESIAAFCSNGR
jgi:hypothetical protein